MGHQIPAADIDNAILDWLTTEPRISASTTELKRWIAGRFPPPFTPLSSDRIRIRLEYLRSSKQVMVAKFNRAERPVEWRLYPDLADILPGALRQVLAGLIETRASNWPDSQIADIQIEYAKTVLLQCTPARAAGDRSAIRDFAVEVAWRLIDAANTIDAELQAARDAEPVPF